MDIKNLRKDKQKSVKINSEILKVIESGGMTLQDFLDEALNKTMNIELTTKDKE